MIYRVASPIQMIVLVEESLSKVDFHEHTSHERGSWPINFPSLYTWKKGENFGDRGN